jgi:methanogenic corrinoid protein MtbC1
VSPKHAAPAAAATQAKRRAATPPEILGKAGLALFGSLETDAVAAVTAQLFGAHAATFAPFGARGREVCQDVLGFSLQFLRPVLESGHTQQMVDYLVWVSGALQGYGIPPSQLRQSLDGLAAFFASRMAPADGAVVVAAQKAAWKGFTRAARLPLVAPLPTPPWAEAAAFEAAVLAGNQSEALAVIKGCMTADHGLVEVEMNVIQPALYDIGRQWRLNQISVAQEHLATAITQSVMTICLLGAPVTPTQRKRALIACVAGNRLTVGARMVCDAFELAGWEVQFLGADTPTSALLEQAVHWSPDLIGLSVSFPEQLGAVRDLMRQLTQRLDGQRPRVVLGGLALNRFSPLAEMIGADAYCADPTAAVAYANSAVGLGESDALVSA